eukprot:ANDGO_07349.mRNA.1 Very-long-chain (3R)-3-hydroxyacyl-CoA dehydratase PASTICCINO 2
MGAVKTGYLVVYNLVCTAGWGYVLYRTLVIAQANCGLLGLPSLQSFLSVLFPSLVSATVLPAPTAAKYAAVYAADLAQTLTVVQSLAILEIVHCMIGLVRSPVFSTFMQVFSRVFLVWGILNVPGNTAPFAYPFWITMCVAWAISELVRYPFYAFELVGSSPALLTWARYSLFYVLYPVGVASELANVVVSLPFFRQTRVYSVAMPNAYNFAFDYTIFTIIVLLLYIPGFPMLFNMMRANRAKKLAAPKKEKAL